MAETENLPTIQQTLDATKLIKKDFYSTKTITTHVEMNRIHKYWPSKKHNTKTLKTNVNLVVSIVHSIKR